MNQKIKWYLIRSIICPRQVYFNWMCQLVFDGRYSKKLSYRRLLKVLHKIEFTYSIPMDGNRAEDGIDLRYRFGYENGYSIT
ncbi:hypothetical protein [[Ruminococcus] torques]|uniref:hypothetical protein n=1 Tax=[Ruminococcus] torques TaxID=33039 RepID=UPI001FAAC174|nr:hypothetical protein [[Ruminococcus] torques]